MITEAQIYAPGIYAIACTIGGICALSICALSTCVLGILRISEWSIILSSPRSYCLGIQQGTKNNAGCLGLNWLYTKYYRLTTNWPRSTFVESPLQIHLLLCQTNPIYRVPKMNVSTVLTRDYKNDDDFALRKTNPNKPNQTKFRTVEPKIEGSSPFGDNVFTLSTSVSFLYFQCLNRAKVSTSATSDTLLRYLIKRCLYFSSCSSARKTLCMLLANISTDPNT